MGHACTSPVHGLGGGRHVEGTEDEDAAASAGGVDGPPGERVVGWPPEEEEGCGCPPGVVMANAGFQMGIGSLIP